MMRNPRFAVRETYRRSGAGPGADCESVFAWSERLRAIGDRWQVGTMRLVGRCIGVVGGGIGGPAAALALQSLGPRVIVYERTRRQHQGVALLVWGNAMRALASLGVAEPLLAVAAPIDRTQVRNADGELLCELPIG